MRAPYRKKQSIFEVCTKVNGQQFGSWQVSRETLCRRRRRLSGKYVAFCRDPDRFFARLRRTADVRRHEALPLKAGEVRGRMNRSGKFSTELGSLLSDSVALAGRRRAGIKRLGRRGQEAAPKLRRASQDVAGVRHDHRQLAGRDRVLGAFTTARSSRQPWAVAQSSFAQLK